MTTNNNTVVIVNNFGKEDTSFLDMETLKKRFLNDGREPRHMMSVDDLIFNGYSINSRPYREDRKFVWHVTKSGDAKRIIEWTNGILTAKPMKIAGTVILSAPGKR